MNAFVMYWPCGKCVCGGTVDNGSLAMVTDVLDAIRVGQIVRYQSGGSVTIGTCTCCDNHDWLPMSNAAAPLQERYCAKCKKHERVSA